MTRIQAHRSTFHGGREETASLRLATHLGMWLSPSSPRNCARAACTIVIDVRQLCRTGTGDCATLRCTNLWGLVDPTLLPDSPSRSLLLRSGECRQQEMANLMLPSMSTTRIAP